MSDMKITGPGIGQTSPQVNSAKSSQQGGFEAVLQDAIGKVSEMQGEAEKGIQQIASGGDITQAIIAMEKANTSFQVMVEVRNKLQTAYEEIMRMQI
jgi:flagellar hook-basal body complex protein FliE